MPLDQLTDYVSELCQVIPQEDEVDTTYIELEFKVWEGEDGSWGVKGEREGQREGGRIFLVHLFLFRLLPFCILLPTRGRGE